MATSSAMRRMMGMYKDMTQGLQNYGGNIRKNINKNSAEFRRMRGTPGFNNYQTKNPFPNPLKRSSYEKP